MLPKNKSILRQHISETEYQRQGEDHKTSERNETDRRIPVEEC